MNRVETEELLKDAHLIINYAVRVGRLPDDALSHAVHVIETAPAGGSPEEISSLLTAVNKGIQAIAPMTLAELRAGRSPFDPQNQRMIRQLQALFCALTITVTVVVAVFTEYLHRQDTALRTVQQIQERHPLDKLHALRKMVQFENALGTRDSIHYDQYHQGLRELRDLQDRLSAPSEFLGSLAVDGPWLWRFGNHARNSSGDNSYPAQYEAALKFRASQAPTAGTLTPTADRSPITDACDSTIQEALRGSRETAPPWSKQITADSAADLCFALKTNLLLALPPPSVFYHVQARIAALSGWVLPFLYGLLGASVFVIRNLLNPRTPTLTLFPSVLRIALGGIAGIIIGWFWAPTAAKGDEIATITSVPFGVAFLTGFSIDILFSLLDRLNRAITDAWAEASDTSEGQRAARAVAGVERGAV